MTKKNSFRERKLGQRLYVNKSFWVISALVLSFLHSPLRLNETSPISAFRAVVPLIFLLGLMPRLAKYRVEISFLIIIFLWSFCTSLIFYDSPVTFLMFYPHLLFIFSLYVLLGWFYERSEDFERVIFGLLDRFTVFTCVLVCLQALFGFHFPNTSPERVNVFYWTENELGMSLAIMVPFYFVGFSEQRLISRVLKVGTIFVILFYNDNKVSLLGCAVALSVYLATSFVGIVKQKMAVGLAMLGLLSTTVLLLFLWNPTLHFSSYSTSLHDLVFEPLVRMIRLEPFQKAGSIFDRTDAIIYGIMELQRSYFLGIGLGNGMTMLSSPPFQLATAKSMHNFYAQLITELGLLGGFLFLFIAYRVIKLFFRNPNHKNNRLRIIFLVSFPIISMQSSSGIFSNYFVWTTLAFLAICSS